MAKPTKKNSTEPIPSDPMIKYLFTLVGATITSLIVESGESEHDETYYGFAFTTKNGKSYQCMILGDAEGNGPGHLEISK